MMFVVFMNRGTPLSSRRGGGGGGGTCKNLDTAFKYVTDCIQNFVKQNECDNNYGVLCHFY